MIHINQLGYPVIGRKQAVVVPAAERFCLIDAESGQTVLEKACETPRYSPSAGETISLADFSECGAGRYILGSGEERSAAFPVCEDPYAALRSAVLDVFDMHRCGMDLDCGPWSHKACHTEPGELYGTDRRYDVRGGWHDAGDYGRYTVPAAKTVADLLWAYLLSPQPDNRVPELVRYEIDWILRMRDEEGGVFHKVSCAHFCGFISPEEERERLVICPVSATATGACAAVFALGSRVYKDSDPGYAAALLEAARKSYAWLKAHPDYPAFHNPEGVQTGEYDDENDRDERYWAACELYAATGEVSFWEDARILGIYTGFGWANTGYYGSMAAVFSENDAKKDPDDVFYRRVRDSLLRDARAVLKAYDNEPYGISLGLSFPWGSNMNVANNAVLLLVANRLNPLESYRVAAAEHLHYLLGRNALGICYVSGFGTLPAKNLHHRPSYAAGKTMPGMLAGGPSAGLEDDYARLVLTGSPPQKCYVDDMRSYATNEMTIYWNSPLYTLLSLL